MQFPLIEPTSTRYIHVNPVTNRVHLLVPFVGGEVISTDNTCKSDVEVRAFFEGGAVNELEGYQSVLEFHISLLEEGDPRRRVKEERLAQINLYLDALREMRGSYQTTVDAFLSKPSNLYSIQLRPTIQDPISRVVNPVFTVNRENDRRGNPLSHLYNEMHRVFPSVSLGQSNPHQKLVSNVLDALSEFERTSAIADEVAFAKLQDLITATYKAQLPEEVAKTVQDDFFKSVVDVQQGKQTVDKDYIDRVMGFTGGETPEDYFTALLRCCVPSLETTQEGSPFYQVADSPDKAERLSIMIQFYLGVLNVYCRAQGISDKNFGEVLDKNATLSHALVTDISDALTRGEAVETSIITFFNAHAGKDEFDLSAVYGNESKSGESEFLTPTDTAAIQQQFEVRWRTVTATKENPHMDDFMLLDMEARGETAPFLTRKGLICTDFANIAPTTAQNQAYFDEVRQEASTHPNVVTPQDEPVVMVDLEPEALIDKLENIQWDRLPKEIEDACRTLPAFQIRQFLDDVAKGKQAEAEALLEAAEDKQFLLRTPAKFTDYSGRTFNCTAYEYAYWAKDKHMCRMLERHMDDDTKALLLDKVNEMEQGGLAYKQHGIAYKNPHYDMSFVLKDLNAAEFGRLQTMVGKSVDKIRTATVENYQNLAFTADEYEALKKALEPHKQKRITSFFYTSTPNAISNKLKFDFHSLITALDTYVKSFYSRPNHHQQEADWMNVGKAQRDVPAHIAHEYCCPNRSFLKHVPLFNEDNLPRTLTFQNFSRSPGTSWFPLSSSSSGLGFDFGLFSTSEEWQVATHILSWPPMKPGPFAVEDDLRALRYLDKVRINDLTQSRENLSQPSGRLEMVS